MHIRYIEKRNSSSSSSPQNSTLAARSVYFGQSGTTVRPLISRLDLSWGGEAKLAFGFKWLSKLFPLAFPPLANRTLPSLHTRMSEYYFPSWNHLIDRPRHQRHFLLAFTNHFSHHLSFPQLFATCKISVTRNYTWTKERSGKEIRRKCNEERSDVSLDSEEGTRAARFRLLIFNYGGKIKKFQEF